MMRKGVVIELAAAGIFATVGLASLADQDDEGKATVLSMALPDAPVSLDQGLKASERAGKPISGRYDIEHRALQLSVYTDKGDQFSEVIVDHKTGAIKKAAPITDADDLKDAREQSQAMVMAKISLDKAVEDAAALNDGYRPISIVPRLSGGRPVADITLLNGINVRKVRVNLD